MVPTVLAPNRLNLRIRPEVSELSTAGAVSLPIGPNQAITIPALTVRRAETTIELGSGQSFAIAGLLQRTSTDLTNALPYLGEMPVLGALFKSTQFQRGESELVIIVTPYIVRPAASPAAAARADRRVRAGDRPRPHPVRPPGGRPRRADRGRRPAGRGRLHPEMSAMTRLLWLLPLLAGCAGNPLTGDPIAAARHLGADRRQRRQSARHDRRPARPAGRRGAARRSLGVEAAPPVGRLLAGRPLPLLDEPTSSLGGSSSGGGAPQGGGNAGPQ